MQDYKPNRGDQKLLLKHPIKTCKSNTYLIYFPLHKLYLSIYYISDQDIKYTYIKYTYLSLYYISDQDIKYTYIKYTFILAAVKVKLVYNNLHWASILHLDK